MGSRASSYLSLIPPSHVAHVRTGQYVVCCVIFSSGRCVHVHAHTPPMEIFVLRSNYPDREEHVGVTRVKRKCCCWRTAFKYVFHHHHHHHHPLECVYTYMYLFGYM